MIESSRQIQAARLLDWRVLGAAGNIQGLGYLDLYIAYASDSYFNERQIMSAQITPAQLAEKFHETYEWLAPRYFYETRKETARPWKEVPEPNRQLMIHTAKLVLEWMRKVEESSES